MNHSLAALPILLAASILALASAGDYNTTGGESNWTATTNSTPILEEARHRFSREPCQVEVGFRRPGNASTFRLLFVDSPEECCNRCRRDPRCQSWNRDAVTGACGLKRDAPELVADPDYDSGVIAGEVVQDEVPLTFPCLFVEGLLFPGSNIFRGGNATDDEQACCRMCERTPTCFAWSWHGGDGMCFMKNRLPPVRNDTEFVSGTTL